MAGIINSLRSRAWLVIGFIAFSLFLFIASSVLSNDFNALFQGDRTSVAEIGGQRIDYNTFNTTYQNTLARAGGQTDEATKQQVLQQAWEQQINEQLLGKEMDQLGLTVTRSESTRLILGPDPSPMMLQIPDFRNPDGSFNSDRVRELISQGNTNPQLGQQLRDLQVQVNTARRQEKYIQLLQQATFVSLAETRRMLSEQRSSASFDYLAVNYAAVADTAVTLSDGDYRSYYDEHKERFRLREPQAVIQYVSFPKQATAADSAALRTQIATLRAEFATTTEDSLFAAQNSDLNEPTSYQNLLSLDDSLRGRVRNAAPGTVLGPLAEGNRIRLVKVLDQRTDTLPDARIRIVLLQQNAGLADSLVRVATAENFQTLAIQFSEDPQSRFSGGDLGLYQYGSLGAEVDKAIRTAKTGVIRQSFASPRGTLLVQVTEKNDREIRLATLTKEIVASPATINALDRQAREFAAAAQEAGLDSAARKAGYDVRTSLPLTVASNDIPGLEQGRGLIQWAFFDETKVAKASDLRDVGNALVVANLQSRYTDDYRPLDAVKEDIRVQVLNRKKAAFVKAKLGDTKGQELQSLTGKVQGAFVSSAQNINPSAPGIPGIGTDPAIVGAAFGLPLNTVSQPLEGRTGVYVLKVTQRTAAADSSLTDTEVKDLQTRLAAQRKQQMVNRLYQGLREAAKVKDYRYRYEF